MAQASSPMKSSPSVKAWASPSGGGLDLVGESHAKLSAVAKQVLKARRILRGGDDENVANAREHEGGKRVVDHRLVVDGQQLLAGDHGEWVEARTCASGQDDATHGYPPHLRK